MTRYNMTILPSSYKTHKLITKNKFSSLEKKTLLKVEKSAFYSDTNYTTIKMSK